MAKKTKIKKNSKSSKNSKTKKLTKEEIKDLKENLLIRKESSDKSKKEIKMFNTKKKKKDRKIEKEKREDKIKNNKIKKEKEKLIERNKRKKKFKIKQLENGGKGNSKNKKKEIDESEDYSENKNKTLFQIIKDKENLKEINLNENNYSSTNKINIKKIQKKNSIDKSEDIKPKNNADDKNEYIKKLKSKIVMVNGKMVMEKPDVGLINKKYNEEHYKNLSPLETVFANHEEKVVNSLSFINLKPSKKWTEEENKLFYKAIELFGLDFSMIEIVLKKRTREEIKRKFLKEKMENYKEIEKVMNSRKNIGKLKQILELYKNEKGQNYLGLFKEESFRSRRNIQSKNEKVDYDKEYKKILNKE